MAKSGQRNDLVVGGNEVKPTAADLGLRRVESPAHGRLIERAQHAGIDLAINSGGIKPHQRAGITHGTADSSEDGAPRRDHGGIKPPCAAFVDVHVIPWLFVCARCTTSRRARKDQQASCRGHAVEGLERQGRR